MLPPATFWRARNGILGVQQDQFVNLLKPSEESWKRIAASPGAALGSGRKMLSPEEAMEAVSLLRKKDVRYFFHIGGNDSMDTALKMRQAALALGYEMYCAGIPKTIDNDLPCTDHCPGFGSAARYIAQATLDLGMDIRSLPTPVSILEVMGRDAGWLTAATLLARRNPDDAPHLIYAPEVPLNRQKFLDDVQNAYDCRGCLVVAVSEGVRNEAGESWSARRSDNLTDGFGHPLSGDVAATLASLVTSNWASAPAAKSQGGWAGRRAGWFLLLTGARRKKPELSVFPGP